MHVARSIGSDSQPADTIVAARPQGTGTLIQTLRDMALATGSSPVQVVRDYTNLAFGPGKISFDDYVRLRLFDSAYWADGDRRTVVGQRRNRDIIVDINYRHDWYGLFVDKVASASYLAAHGLPSIPVVAVFAPRLTKATPHILRNSAELARFLSREDVYPLFGKPTEGFQSLGSIALRRPHQARAELELINGTFISLSAFVDDISRHYEGGYVFEPFTPPHPAAAALYGEKLGTVRVVTLRDGDGARIFRAGWKIPSGQNTADNFWRSGNLLAKIDINNGAIERVIAVDGLQMTRVTHHPDTGAPLIGAVVPLWHDLREVALEGARLMQRMPMIGWDIGASASGPVIVEMNETPDLSINQLADARGVLEPDFLAFMESQQRAAKAHETWMKRQIAKL